jgi:hypothetical protein
MEPQASASSLHVPFVFDMNLVRPTNGQNIVFSILSTNLLSWLTSSPWSRPFHPCLWASWLYRRACLVPLEASSIPL